jgi:hypothetical protein
VSIEKVLITLLARREADWFDGLDAEGFDDGLRHGNPTRVEEDVL